MLITDTIILFLHSPSIGYVPHPLEKIPDLKQMVGHIGIYKSGAYITAMSDKDKDREVNT